MKKKEELKTRLRSYGHQYYKMIGNFTGEEREKWLDRNDEEIIVWIEEEVRQAEEKAFSFAKELLNQKLGEWQIRAQPNLNKKEAMSKKEFEKKWADKIIYKNYVYDMWLWIEEKIEQTRLDELEYIRDTAPKDEVHLVKRLNQRIDECKIKQLNKGD